MFTFISHHANTTSSGMHKMKHGLYHALVRMWNIENARALLVGVEIGVSNVEDSLALHTEAEHDQRSHA